MTSTTSGTRCFGAAAAMLLLAAVSASAQPAGNVAPAEATNWRADLAQLARHLEAAHGDAFHTISRSDFTKMVTALDRRIPELARHEIIVEMQRITAAVGDGHTAVQLFFDSDVGFHRLPIRLGWFDEGIFVEAASPEAGLAPGARLLAIGGVGIDEAVRRVTPLISRDNDIWIRVVAPMLLVSPRCCTRWGLPRIQRPPCSRSSETVGHGTSTSTRAARSR